LPPRGFFSDGWPQPTPFGDHVRGTREWQLTRTPLTLVGSPPRAAYDLVGRQPSPPQRAATGTRFFFFPIRLPAKRWVQIEETETRQQTCCPALPVVQPGCLGPVTLLNHQGTRRRFFARMPPDGGPVGVEPRNHPTSVPDHANLRRWVDRLGQREISGEFPGRKALYWNRLCFASHLPHSHPGVHWRLGDLHSGESAPEWGGVSPSGRSPYATRIAPPEHPEVPPPPPVFPASRTLNSM